MVSVFILVVGLCDIFWGPSAERSLLINAAALTLAAIGFGPTERKFQELTDRFFFKKRFDFHKTIQSVSRAMTSILEPQAIYDLLVNSIEKELRVSSIELYILEDEVYKPKVIRGKKGKAYPLGSNHQLIEELTKARGVIGRSKNKARFSFFQQIDQVLVPLQTNNTLTGFLIIGSKRSGEAFSNEDLSALNTLANQTMIGIQNSRSYQLSHSRLAEMRTIAEVGKIISSALDFQKVLDTVIESVSDVIDVDRGMLLLYNEKTQELVAQAGFGAQKEDVLKVRLPINDSIFGKIFTEGKPVRQKASRKTEYVLRLQAEEYIAVPMKGKDKMIGLLAFDNKTSQRSLDTINMELLVTLANQTGLAIENARLYEETIKIKNYNENILRHMTSGIITIDAHGIIKTFNQQTTALTGLEEKEALGRPLTDVLGNSSIFTKAFSGPQHNLQGIFKNIQGVDKHLTISTTQLLDHQSNISGLLAVVTDTTEIKTLESHVRQADRLAILGTMAATLAHEIKNPLASMKLFVQLMSESWQDPNFWTTYGTIMSTEVDRLCQVVEDFLGFARSYDLNLEKIKVQEVLEKVQALLKTQFLNNNIAFSIEVAEPFPEVVIDPQRMIQVFMNLLLNAMQAMPAERPDKHIWVRLAPIGAEALISISDNGCGIPPENLEKLFTPFFTTKQKGTGLGLSTVQRIIEEHGGKITAQSTLGSGTTFTISLPIPTGTEDLLTKLEEGLTPFLPHKNPAPALSR